jgi:hypothetical protein
MDIDGEVTIGEIQDEEMVKKVSTKKEIIE